MGLVRGPGQWEAGADDAAYDVLGPGADEDNLRFLFAAGNP